MDALSNADRFVVLLRQRLAEKASAKRGTAAKRTGTASQATETAPRRPLAELAAQSGADHRTLRRTIVEQLMADRLGTGLTNEPRFQQVIEQVTDIIAADPELGAILEEVVLEIRR